MGLGYHELRFLDRYRTRRHPDLGDLVPATPKMADLDQPFGRGDDPVRGYVRGNFPRHSRWPGLDGLVSGADSEQLRHLAKLSKPADVGRVRSLDLFHGVSFILVHGIDS